jgi:hypothetical protein
MYLVAAQLSEMGFIVSPTSRNAQGADLLVTDPDCIRAISVQVKTNATTFNFWLMGEKNRHMRSPSFIYALVNLRRDRTEFFIVPSAVVADGIIVSHSQRRRRTGAEDMAPDALAQEQAARTTTWYSFPLAAVEPYRNNWPLFEP